MSKDRTHMRILIITSDAHGGYGGIAEYNRNLIAALASSPRVREIVVIPRFMPGTPNGIPSKTTYVLSGLGGKFNFVWAVISAFASRNKFDLVIYGHIHLLPLVRLPFARAMSSVLFIYGVEAWHRPRSYFLWRTVLERMSVVSISKFSLNHFLSWISVPNERCLIIPNSVNLKAFHPGPKSPDLLNRYGLHGKKVILTIGRMSAIERAKGFDQIIDVMPALLEQAGDVAYLAVGDGTDRPRLMEKVRRLGLQNRVIFPGYVKESEKVDHYCLADVYAMPSRLEGFGFVFLEALACGIPVVASRLDAGPEALHGTDRGVAVDPNDRDSLLAGLLSMLQIPVGVVPDTLENFSYEQFEKKVHSML